MKPLHPNLLATRLSPTEVGEGRVRGYGFGEASRWGRSSNRPLVAKAVLKRRTDHMAKVVSQPWQTCENSAPDATHGQISSERINEVALDSPVQDQCLTGELTAEGLASRLDISRAAVASGDAKSIPQVRIHEPELGRAWRAGANAARNLLS